MAPFEPPSSSSHSSRASSIQSDRHLIRARSPSHLRPEDAFSPPRKRPSQHRPPSPLGRSDTVTASSHSLAQENVRKTRRSRPRDRSRSRRRGVPKPQSTRPWKKLLWVKQQYPDNYTDEETFLDHLQRNPRLRPYEFWPLVADSTIIVQHVCSVIIFVSCFTAIFQERLGPTTVVSWATGGTLAGWVAREVWRRRDERHEAENGETVVPPPMEAAHEDVEMESRRSDESAAMSAERSSLDAMLREADASTASLNGVPNGLQSRTHSRNPSITSAPGANQFLPGSSPIDTQSPTLVLPYHAQPSSFSPRTQEYLTTAKSATLIYCALLGLSPILKSLTRSTSPDSIWALSTWLLAINIFTFDYGAGPEQKFPAPLSTNAALMASTVLASRLERTGGVFGLTLFSIEVFGLFPVFRRHLRAQSWVGHAALTLGLVILASGGLTAVIVGPAGHRVALHALPFSTQQALLSEMSCESGICLVKSGLRWAWTVFGAIAGVVITALFLGITSWWLIGLQRYKNEIRGPWDPARPVTRRGHWE